MRQLINKYGTYIIIGAIVAAGLGYWLIAPRTAHPHIAKSAFFIDEETGEETVRPISEIPPLLGKSGKPTVVRVIKYTCDGGKTSKPLFYSKYTDAARAQLVAIGPEDDVNGRKHQQLMAEGELIRDPAPNSPWIPGNSEQADHLRSFPPCPGGATPLVYLPEN